MEMAYIKVVSQYELAKSTVEFKQKERYEDVVKFYLEFIDKYPQSSFLKTAEKWYSDSQGEVIRIAKLEADYKAMQEKEKSNTSKIATSPQ
jgi:outer membrane protein assembly factor BamD